MLFAIKNEKYRNLFPLYKGWLLKAVFLLAFNIKIDNIKSQKNVFWEVEEMDLSFKVGECQDFYLILTVGV